MKNLLLTIAFFVCTVQINAQNDWDASYLGLKAGLNYANNSFKDPSLTDMEASYKSGFAGGIYCNIGFCSKFAVQTELLYSSMGTKLKSTIADQNYDATLKLDYISVPILFKVIPTSKLGVFIGPQFDFMMGAKLETDEQVESIKGTDFAGTVGLEYWINNNLAVYGRYIYGFQNINDGNPGITFNSTDIKSNTMNTAFQVGISLGLKVKKETSVVSMPAPVKPVKPVIVDSDGDGVPDKDDKCPNVAGLAKYAGCPIPDTDGDGVNDENDKCPNTPGIADNMGCPELIIYFQKEEAGLTDDDKTHLDKVVTFMNNNPGLNVIVEGHTSTPGTAEFNQTLSEKRAGEAVDYIVSKGISKNRMQAIGLGEKFPIGDNTTEEGKAKSRRVVIKIAK